MYEAGRGQVLERESVWLEQTDANAAHIQMEP